MIINYRQAVPLEKPAQPPDENTLLLLHGEDLVDSSMYNHAITNFGCMVDPGQRKFGNNSIEFQNTYLTITSPMFVFGGQDFTIDWWEYRTTAIGTVAAINTGANTHSNFLLTHYSGGGLFSSSAFGGWDVLSLYSGAFTPKESQWSHKALVRNGNRIMTFDDGVMAINQTISANFSSGQGQIVIGKHIDPGNPDYFSGHIDEFRISNVARWTGNFTPPTEPY